MDTILNRPTPGSAQRSAGPFYMAPRRGPLSVAGWLLALLLTWQERARQRHALASMDDRMLKDIGLGRADVVMEMRKPFWRV